LLRLINSFLSWLVYGRMRCWRYLLALGNKFTKRLRIRLVFQRPREYRSNHLAVKTGTSALSSFD